MINELPVEILHRIFDYLDIQTIIFSIRYVCKQLYLMTNSYNRYRLNMTSISRGHFRWICQLISMENVIALILSDEDQTRGQIQFFLSLCSLEQLTRLQSLTLLQIDHTRLNIFLQHIITCPFRTLSITLQTFQPERNPSTISVLSSAIAHPTLEILSLDIGLKNWNDLSWPDYCTLRYLRIVNSITLDYLCLILGHSPCLKTLVLKEITIDNEDEIQSIGPFRQVTSLIFEDGQIQILKLDQCLSLMPSLTYLKLIGNGTFFDWSFDGFQWQTILQTRLPSLKHLQFFFNILTSNNYRPSKIDNLISSYQTAFWLETLQCSITCEHIRNSQKILLYTHPIRQKHFVYYPNAKKTSRSNFLTRTNVNDMDDVQQLEVTLTKDMNPLSTTTSQNYLFRHVDDLKLGNGGDWPKNSLQILSNILDLSHLVTLSLSISFIPEYMSHTISQIQLLFNRACNLHSLLLYDYWTPENCSQRMEIICSIITLNIKHLQIRVKDFNDIKYILERLEHLTSVTFEYAQMLIINRQELLQSLAYLNRYSSTWDSQYALYLWFGKKKE